MEALGNLCMMFMATDLLVNRTTRLNQRVMTSVIDKRNLRGEHRSMAAEQRSRISVMLRKDGLREERSSSRNRHREVHLPKICPHGARLHRPKSREGGEHLPGKIEEDHELPLVSLNMILMYKNI